MAATWDMKSLTDLVAINPTIGTLNLLLADTEYYYTLPAGVKKFLAHTRDESAWRLAFVTGKVATPTEPYFTVPAGARYSEDLIMGTGSIYLFAASDVANKCLEVIYWTG